MKPILVFGSNLAGIHGAGAALHAKKYLGAKQGRGFGLMGECYALPTKDKNLRPLSIHRIKQNVDIFLGFAKENPNLTFRVSRVACGYAGFADSDIAPLFDKAPANCQLPGLWLRRLNPNLYRVIIAGSRDIENSKLPRINKRLDKLLEHALQNQLQIVSGMAPNGGDQIGLSWAFLHGLRETVAEFPADWARFKRPAGHIRNSDMAWYGTHLIALWDGKSPGTHNMIKTAQAYGLQTRVILLDRIL